MSNDGIKIKATIIKVIYTDRAFYSERNPCKQLINLDTCTSNCTYFELTNPTKQKLNSAESQLTLRSKCI